MADRDAYGLGPCVWAQSTAYKPFRFRHSTQRFILANYLVELVFSECRRSDKMASGCTGALCGWLC